MIRALALILTVIGCPAVAGSHVLAIEFDGPDGVDAIYASVDDLRATVTTDPGGAAAVSVRLHATYDDRFTDLTSRHVGEVGRIIVCGDIVNEPRLMSPLYQASFIITGVGTNQEAKAMVATLNGAGCDANPSG